MSLYAHGLVHSWPTLPLRLLGLAHILAEHHNAETGECFPSVAKLAQHGETSERSIQRSLQELEDRGVISRHTSHSDGGGRQTSNHYLFHAYAGGGGRVTSTSPPPDTGVGGEGDTSVTPMLIRNKETYSSLREESDPGGHQCHPPGEPKSGKRQKPNVCPYAEIRRLWGEILPTCPQPLPVENWTPARKAQLRARWQNELPSLEHWRRTFEYIRESLFLMGRTENGSRRPFRCTLWWISKPENLSKLYEGQYDA